MRFGLASIVVCVALGGLTGCSMFMRSIERPTATVREVSLSSAGLGGVAGQLRLDVSNPNSVGVPLSGIDWQLSVGGARAVTGAVQLSQTIPARGVAPVTTSLSISAADAIAVASVMSRGARDYTLTAKLTFSTAVGPLEIEVKHRGELSGGGGGGLPSLF
ncbi:MAG: LEA type 2 family protein [Kofleriaceae bacterium]